MLEDNSTKATYYHYKLIKKVNIHRPLLWCYLSLPIIMLVFLMAALHWTSFFLFALALPVMMWVHFVITRSFLVIKGSPFLKRWSYNWKLPWQGYMPEQYVGYPTFSAIQFHVMWIGFCFTIVFLFFSPPSFTLSLLFWHIWLAAPRLWALYLLKRERKDGMIKFNKQDVSYYQQ